MYETIIDLEEQIAGAMRLRLPQLSGQLVRPFQVVCFEDDTWVVARSGSVALAISLETERFGVGSLSASAAQLDNTDFYPMAELAVQAFSWAKANDA